MEQTKQTQNANLLTLADVVKMFKGKLKAIICIALICAVIGAGVGVLLSFTDAVYGGEIKFYLSPGESSQTLIPLLQSEAFAERLLLDEYGLPPKSECKAEDYDAALAAVKAEQEARAEKLRLSKVVAAYPYELALVEEEYKVLSDEYSRIYNLLNIYKSAPAEAVSSQAEHLQMISEYEKQLDAAAKARNTYKAEKYDPAMAKKLELDEEYYAARRALDDARKLSDELVEKAVAPWREKEEIKELVGIIQESVTYSYAKIIDSDKVTESQDNLNVAFLEISVNVKNNPEAAENIMNMIKKRTPDFVENKIERITGTSEAHCTLISTFADSEDVGDTSLIKNTVIYGAVAAVAAIALTCVIIIIKGLLPPELLTKKEKKKKKKSDNSAQN